MKQHFPATSLNRHAILRVLRRVLPRTGLALELASGSGEHAAFFAPRLAPLIWQPSDRDPDLLASIEAWRMAADGAAGADNLRPPCEIDIVRRPWPATSADAVIAINLLHVSPAALAGDVIAGAADVLRVNGILYFYGPFMVGGRHTTSSNAAFDRRLRAQDAEWGLRDLDEITALAASCGLDRLKNIRMPANNLSVIFRKTTET